MTTHRIARITLDDQSLTARSPDIQSERDRAVSDLLLENTFRLKTADGPYDLGLSLKGDRLVLNVSCAGHREDVPLALNLLKRHIHDYIIICDNFYKTAREGHLHRLEAIDMGRRALHDEGAAVLAQALEDKVSLDKPTARRLFSLIYVLHMRGIAT